MIAYKLMRVRKDETLGPLFFDASLRIRIGETHDAKIGITKKGFAYRPGWHCVATPHAPHLSMKGRAWVKVLISDFVEHIRPAHQGDKWYLANKMTFLEFVDVNNK
jgi:hypothetical protein